jgi:hypothetical protein
MYIWKPLADGSISAVSVIAGRYTANGEDATRVAMYPLAKANPSEVVSTFA